MKKIGTKIFSLLAVLFVIFFVFAAVILASLNSIKSAGNSLSEHYLKLETIRAETGMGIERGQKYINIR